MKKDKLIDGLLYHLNFTEPELAIELKTLSEIEIIPKNTEIIKQDQFIKWFTIVLKGKIRVWHQHKDRQFTLYKIKDYETCVYSVVAIEKSYQSLVNAKTLSDTTLLKIPIRYLSEWKKYPSWQNFIFLTLIEKYECLLNSVELLAFKKINERIINYLKEESKRMNSKVIKISHNEIAKEIGTTREVVSKSLKKIEQKGGLSLKFKKIKLK